MDISEFTNENFRNHVLKSRIPPMTKTEPCLVGVDEAGRGPVLGPMVYGICYCPLSAMDRLKEMKFADSKTLTESQREELFSSLDKEDHFGWMIKLISPNFISNSMLSRSKYNLNALSQDAASKLIETAINDGINVTEVYVDTVGDPEKYKNKLLEKFPDIKVTVSKKADSLFPIVSAASIVAKVARDDALRNWKFEDGIEAASWGSGYPNDPETKQFLVNSIDRVFGFPQIVRFSWSTAEKILEEKTVAVEWEKLEDDTKDNTSNLMHYFSLKNASKPVEPKMHRFFNDAGLKRIITT